MDQLMTRFHKVRNRKGFTLVELIVVIVIIGILAAIIIPKISGFTDSAKERAAEAEHRTLISAIQMWQSEQTDPAASWPANNSDLDPYLNGGWAGLKHTHSIADGVLTTTNPKAGGTDWVYTP